jgi:hypothetical protein
MAFSKLSLEITEYILSFLNPRECIIGISDKFPKFARISFIESLHPLYRFIWISTDFLRTNEKQIIQITLERGFSEDTIFYLIKKGFQTNALNFKYVCLNNYFNLIKYYLKKEGKLILFLDNIVKYNRTDIIQWLFDNNYLSNYEKYKCMSIALLKNDIILLDYLHSLGFPLVHVSSTVYEEFEFDFLKHKIYPQTIDWCWQNGYKWTRQEAIESDCADLLKYFSE